MMVLNDQGGVRMDITKDQTSTLRASMNGNVPAIMPTELTIRRLTPLECERLQGLPDNWTLIDDKTCSDTARYKAIGNGMAQPCADFVLRRIVLHETR